MLEIVIRVPVLHKTGRRFKGKKAHALILAMNRGLTDKKNKKRNSREFMYSFKHELEKKNVIIRFSGKTLEEECMSFLRALVGIECIGWVD